MPRWIQTAAVLLPLVSVGLHREIAAEDRNPPSPDVGLSALIDQLDDEDFDRRQAAVTALAEKGTAAIDRLILAAQNGSPEVASRAVRLLERLMETDNLEAIDAADAALVALTDSNDPQASHLAASALDRKSRIREQRAITCIRELGGQVQVGRMVDLHGSLLPGVTEETARELRPRVILLGKSWEGGLEGLSHLRKLSHLSYLAIYVEKGCSVSLADAQSLASVLPNLSVHHRGPYLGVQAASNGLTDCLISEVKSDTPADKAGLQRGDIVIALEDQPVQQFNDLIEGLKQYGTGDQVTISVLRDDPLTRRRRPIHLEVTLEDWKLPEVIEDGTSKP